MELCEKINDGGINKIFVKIFVRFDKSVVLCLMKL